MKNYERLEAEVREQADEYLRKNGTYYGFSIKGPVKNVVNIRKGAFVEGVRINQSSEGYVPYLANELFAHITPFNKSSEIPTEAQSAYYGLLVQSCKS